jgi:hypothetical protein
MDDVYREAQEEAGPILRLISRGARRLGQIVGDDRDMYFERGGDWIYNPHTETWELTRFDAVADLRGADLPRMTVSYLNSRLSALPLSVWLDADGLVRRLRYETTPPGRDTPMHRRLDFFDFGAAVERPEIREGG